MMKAREYAIGIRQYAIDAHQYRTSTPSRDSDRGEVPRSKQRQDRANHSSAKSPQMFGWFLRDSQ